MTRGTQLIFGLVMLAVAGFGLFVLFAVTSRTLHLLADAVWFLALLGIVLARWRLSRSRQEH